MTITDCVVMPRKRVIALTPEQAAARQAQWAEAAVPKLRSYERAIQDLLDRTARHRGYESIQTAVTYRDDPNPTFAAEGTALFGWRSAVWTAAYAELARVTAGETPAPALDVFIASLPAFSWPS
ncbi:hypothetical protein FHS55_002624 [Angulomicrobium tetraedrale]|uniref:Uncharacterized protein n=1 Tax=Ancylobacter tetraedralis TaxID=217068 RepID=A0A839ZBA8_9HYPH|nr:hypothetical protein [Ancylobacter tetraedralis]MBB3772015.1 hypothetical protein [Ancylobacter tetraedralis]